jgi:peptidoglycan lytic transglycosylase G
MSSLFEQLETDTGDPGQRPPGGRRKRRRGLALFVAFVVLVAAVAVAGFTYYRWCQGGSGSGTPVTVVVPKGASGSQVVSTLHAQGIIRCGGLVSRVALRSKNESFQAGTYHLTTNMGFDAALAALASGPEAGASTRFTIPPGWRITQIADRVQRLLHIPAKTFEDAAFSGDHSLPPYLPKGSKSVEGFLLPNTYQFRKHGNTADSVITYLLDQFRSQTTGLPWGNAAKLGVSEYQIVTIASMIEKETGYPPDRAKVSAVIYNRLKLGMPLQIDATLLYDDPTPGDNSLSNADLRSNSPYNTRHRPGLPPTPIASPSLASLRAALQPADVNYLYYVKCGSKGHSAFTASYSEFLRLEAHCLG